MNLRLIAFKAFNAARRDSVQSDAVSADVAERHPRYVSFAEGERYGNSSRPSCICFGRRNGVNHIFDIYI
jgi:hypothetical protein